MTAMIASVASDDILRTHDVVPALMAKRINVEHSVCTYIKIKNTSYTLPAGLAKLALASEILFCKALPVVVISAVRHYIATLVTTAENKKKKEKKRTTTIAIGQRERTTTKGI